MTVHSQGAVTSAPQDAPPKSAGLPETPTPATGPGPTPPRGGGKSLPAGWLPYLLVAPAVLALATLLLYPLIKNVILSLQDINKIEFIQRKYPFAGLDNYTELLGDSNFWTVVVRSFGFTLANVALIMVLGSLIGILLNKLGKKMRLVLSMALVMAWAMPIVASVQVFRWLFDEQFGVMNWVMRTMRLLRLRAAQLDGDRPLHHGDRHDPGGLGLHSVRRPQHVQPASPRSAPSCTRPRGWTGPTAGRPSGRSSSRT